ncbi:serine hydrolase domain-containing protein [Peristeroidobacter agariperforans]|uniref:serine hydrolase domain-containing protein n=1 Tax=Peristeroidobacter agariperforans TaxID=268404 RepID=UPI00101DED83|nr:serine hydrolase domain-containing protein [Peristeroidobacter agariperforans]
MANIRTHMSCPVRVLIAISALFVAACAGIKPVRTHGPMVREVSDSRFDAYLQEMVEREHFTGAALITRGGEVVHAKAYGQATGSSANEVDTKFHVASITKQFTAAAVVQLVEKGMVKLDSSINSYLPPEYRSEKWDAVTVHHLLSHSSGIEDYAVFRDYYRVTKGFCSDDTVDGMVREAMSKDLQFVPGSKYSYTNLGYTLLGFIIEHQTKTRYEEYVTDNLLDPMGMTSSTIHGAGHIPAVDEAAGFRWSEERGKHVPDETWSLPATAPDAGLVTTLEDFAKWMRIYTAGEQTILSQGSIKLMSSPAIQIGAGGPLDSMGYGLYVGSRLIGHSGRVVGFSSQFIFDRETQSLIVVFANDASSDPQQIALGLLTILLTPKP